MKIVIFGSSKYMIPTIKTLNHNFDLALVVTTEKNTADAVPAFCAENKIPFLPVSSLKEKEIVEEIKNQKATVGVLGYFGLILPDEVLSIFPKGIINIHPSLLPLYRGPTPVQTAILDGRKETGVSIILLDSQMDHGPILIQEKVDINPDDTTHSLHEKLFTKGAELIQRTLHEYLTGNLAPSEQNHDEATYTKHLNKIDGQIDINNPPDKEKMDRMIRAYFPWPTVWTTVRVKGKALRVKLLPDQKIQVEGGKPMSYKDFINGYPEIHLEFRRLL
jgi:methionyl-tRNA formyltransferase